MTDTDGTDRSDRGGREGPGSDSSGSASSESGRRRVLLAAGASLSAAFAGAGCLSNPWGPSSPSADESAGGGDDPPTETAGATTSDGETTADAEPTESDGDGRTTRAEDAETTSDATATETTSDATATETTVPPEEREPDQVVEVAPDGYMFSPETFTIDAGDTVHWRWKDDGHNVRVRDQPADSDWTGTPGDDSDTYGEGYLHAHTFEAAGEYECYCAPHQTLGLEGSFTVR